jgi:hypothetical protein
MGRRPEHRRQRVPDLARQRPRGLARVVGEEHRHRRAGAGQHERTGLALTQQRAGLGVAHPGERRDGYAASLLAPRHLAASGGCRA